MTAYRFCRTDDRALLIAAYEACRGPEDAGEPALDVAGFKQLVRDLDLWCSSSMVAFEGREPVGVLLGAKRPTATLIYALRVHPQHRRRGHGRHLLTSLGQKLAILGPPRLVAEVPAEREAARAVFEACGWKLEGWLTDWLRAGGPRALAASGAHDAFAPIAFQELVAAGLLPVAGPIEADEAEADPAGAGLSGARVTTCWQRDPAALAKRSERISGLAFHSPDGIEAWVLYERGASRGEPGAEVAELGSERSTEDGAWQVLAAGFAPGSLGRPGLAVLIEELARLAAGAPLVLARAAPDELDENLLRNLGFEPGAEHLLYTTAAQAA